MPTKEDHGTDPRGQHGLDEHAVPRVAPVRRQRVPRASVDEPDRLQQIHELPANKERAGAALAMPEPRGAATNTKQTRTISPIR